MAAIAKQLAPDDDRAVISAGSPAQPVPAGAKPAAGCAAPLPMRLRRRACRAARPGRRDEAAPGASASPARGARRARRARRRRRLAQPARRRRGSAPPPPRVAAGAEHVARGDSAGPRRRLHRLPHRARRRALRRRPRRSRRRSAPSTPSTSRPTRTPASAAGRPTSSGARCTTAARRDGRLLYPAFPYPNYTRVIAGRRRRDVRLPAEPAGGGAAEPRAHACAFRYGTQAALAVWRALYFRPGGPRRRSGRARPSGTAAPTWSRASATATPATRRATRSAPTRGTLDLQGGLIPVQNWYAPSLASPREASVADWPKHDVVQLLQDRHRAARLRHGADGRGGAATAPST